MTDRELADLRQDVRDIREQQAEHHSSVSSAIAALSSEFRVSHARIEERMVVLAEQHDKDAKVVAVLKNAEQRRVERVRTVKAIGGTVFALLSAAATAKALGMW